MGMTMRYFINLCDKIFPSIQNDTHCHIFLSICCSFYKLRYTFPYSLVHNVYRHILNLKEIKKTFFKYKITALLGKNDYRNTVCANEPLIATVTSIHTGSVDVMTLF